MSSRVSSRRMITIGRGSEQSSVRAAEDSRIPKPCGWISAPANATASWSAAVLCRFTSLQPGSLTGLCSQIDGSVLNAVLSNTLTLLTFLTLIFAPATLCAEQPAGEEGRSRFSAVDIYIDSKNAPLAAYQLEFSATNGIAKIVGIEGGDSAAFHEPPFYDPKAIQHERAIIAAFSTLSADKLPSGKARVATIHLQIIGDASPQFQLLLQVAANPDGNRVSADATIEERKSE